jgi:hypothetical protein
MTIKQGSLKNPDEPIVFVKDVRKEGGGFKRLEITLAPCPKEGEEPKLLEKVGDKRTNIIMYAGHSTYGRRVENLTKRRGAADGNDQLLMLFQCGGEGNLDDLGRAFPRMQVFSTIDSSTADTDDPTTVKCMRSFVRGENWDTIMGKLPYKAENPRDNWKKLYFAPNTRPVFEDRKDLDGDGRSMKTDLVYQEPSPATFLRSAVHCNPISHDVPIYYLGGENVQSAIDDACSNFRYNKYGLDLEVPGTGQGITLDADCLINNGYFKGSDKDAEAFRFERKLIGGVPRITIKANSRFAHASSDELKPLLAFELGSQLAKWADEPRAECIAHGMAHYFQCDVRNHFLSSDPIGHDLLMKRYDLPPYQAEDLSNYYNGREVDFRPKNLAKFIDDMADWAGDAKGIPRAVGKQLKVPSRAGSLIEAESDDISAKRVAKLFARTAGLEAVKLEAIVPSTSWSGGPLLAQVSKGRKRDVILLELNEETGKPLAIQFLGRTLDVRRIAKQAMIAHVEENEWYWAGKADEVKELIGAGFGSKALSELAVELHRLVTEINSHGYDAVDMTSEILEPMLSVASEKEAAKTQQFFQKEKGKRQMREALDSLGFYSVSGKQIDVIHAEVVHRTESGESQADVARYLVSVLRQRKFSDYQIGSMLTETMNAFPESPSPREQQSLEQFLHSYARRGDILAVLEDWGSHYFRGRRALRVSELKPLIMDHLDSQGSELDLARLVLTYFAKANSIDATSFAALFNMFRDEMTLTPQERKELRAYLTKAGSLCKYAGWLGGNLSGDIYVGEKKLNKSAYRKAFNAELAREVPLKQMIRGLVAHLKEAGMQQDDIAQFLKPGSSQVFPYHAFSREDVRAAREYLKRLA